MLRERTARLGELVDLPVRGGGVQPIGYRRGGLGAMTAFQEQGGLVGMGYVCGVFLPE